MNLTPFTIENRLTESYARLNLLLEQALDIELHYNEAQAELESRKNALLRTSDPKALGANEAAREAAIAGILTTEIVAVQASERARMRHRSAIEIARLHIEEAKQMLRLLELKEGAKI